MAKPTTTATPNSGPSKTTPLFPFAHGNLTAKGLSPTNTTHPTSFLRTPLALLPFPHPKWHVKPSTGEIYEVTSPIFDEYDPVTGYIGSVGEVRQSIEGGQEDMVDWRDEGFVWNGYVSHPESSERSSIQREAKRGRDDRGEGVRDEKRKMMRER